MVQLLDLEALHAEIASLEAGNASLRSSVVSAQLAGDESALQAEETPRSTARLAILSREQKVLVAGLRLGEELVALRKSNEVLFRRGQQLQEENASLRLDTTLLPVQAQQQTTLSAPGLGVRPVQQQSSLSAPGFAVQPVATKQGTLSAPALGVQSVQAYQNSFSDAGAANFALSPAPKKKCSPEEKEERRDLVAQLLKAGLNQDVQTIGAMRPLGVQMPVMPKIQLNQDGYGRSRSTEVEGSRARSGSRTGARNREPSHSGAVEESKYLRELAMRDMLRGISQNTPRR